MIIRSQPKISINQNNYTNKVDNNLFEKHCQLQWSSANLKLYSGSSEKDSQLNLKYLIQIERFQYLFLILITTIIIQTILFCIF